MGSEHDAKPSDPLLLHALRGEVGADRWQDRTSGRSLLTYWAPVWIPLIVLAQVALLGLGPSLRESARLTTQEERLEARFQRESALQAELTRQLRAQSDPVYLERERQLLRVQDSPLRRQ